MNVKQLVLHKKHAKAGARFAPFAGYSMPARFTTIKDEHNCVRERAGLFDVSHMGEIFVRGPEALSAVNRIVTNDMTKLYDGRAIYTVMCNENGGIIDDLIVYQLAENELMLCVNASNREKDYEWIKKQVGSQAKVTDESDDFVQLALQGPLSNQILAKITETPLETIKYYHAIWGEIAGKRTLISRTGYTGEDGFELYIPSDFAPAIYDALLKAGSEFKLQSIGLGARDTLRLESKYHLYGNEMDESVNPIEAGLNWVVKLNTDPFIGQDAIAAFKKEGPSRRLRGLILQGRGTIRKGYKIFANDKQIGTTTSGGIAPALNNLSIGLGYLTIEHCKDDTVEIEIRKKRIPAKVTTKPFYKRS